MKGFGAVRIGTLVFMATDSSHRLTMGKAYKTSSSLKPQGQELSYFVCINV